jgi:hypothetical protein
MQRKPWAKLPSAGRVQLKRDELGEDTPRELCRAFIASVYVLVAGVDGPAELLCPPAGLPHGSDRASLQRQQRACFSLLENRHGKAFTEGEEANLRAYLSVQPAARVLRCAGWMTPLLQPRFVVCLGPGSSLRVLTVGYVGTPQLTPSSIEYSANRVFITASPDLQNGGRWDADLSGVSTIAYCLHRTRHPRIDHELRKHLFSELQKALAPPPDAYALAGAGRLQYI